MKSDNKINIILTNESFEKVFPEMAGLFETVRV